MSGIDYGERIPNNVDLASDRRLQRALEKWQPAFLDWWREMGPVDGAARKAGDLPGRRHHAGVRGRQPSQSESVFSLSSGTPPSSSKRRQASVNPAGPAT